MQILRVGVCTQSGPCGSEIVPAVAVSISAFARALSLEIVSQAGAAAFPVLFTATICSKMQRGEVVGGLNVVPRVPWLGRHGFSDVHFNQFKVSCRGMSSMWRRIKSAAVAKGIVCSPPVVGNSVAIGVINPERRNRYYPVCTKAKLA